jgi:hypothetical protein
MRTCSVGNGPIGMPPKSTPGQFLSRSLWTASADRSARVVVSVPAVIAVDAIPIIIAAVSAAAATVSDIASISRRMEGGPDGSVGRPGVGVRSALFATGELAALPVERGGVLALAVFFAPKSPKTSLSWSCICSEDPRKSAYHGHLMVVAIYDLPVQVFVLTS